VQSSDELTGKTDFDLYPEDEAARCYAEEQEVIRSGESVVNDKRYGVDENGNKICGLTTKMPLRDSSGEVMGLLGISRDITEEEKAEQKLIEYQRQLKSLVSQLTLAEERERRRIAGELHDTVSQSLALSKVKVDALRAGATVREPNEVLAEVSASLDKTIQDTRSLTFDLSYPILYELGFETAVEEWLEENVGRRYGIKTRFYDDGSEKLLDDDVRVLLFRNVRELLTNVVKHSNAKKVKVSVQKLGGEIQVCVKDDGVGFDVEQTVATAARRSEYGLMSIRERLEDIGGSFDIESSPGGGCTATMTVPVNNEQIEAGG
jgi:signal transduction histidine kinase